LEDALRNGYRRIAFTPFADNRYEPILSEIQNWTAEFPKEITFYHLHRKDYGEIYRLFSRP
ncbi:MAG TPA: hypothetical protein PLY73_06525, partial [Candidatus Ozemobacteraceae bacterium]|nr:hypothetical protein [Candidatus Ozemobacteraceae bacterium]